MLVLSRKAGEKLVIGDNITLVVNRISGNRVAIGIDAPHSVRVVRGELEAVVKEFAEDPPETSEEAGPVLNLTDVGDNPAYQAPLAPR